jgi:hypothetical protein
MGSANNGGLGASAGAVLMAVVVAAAVLVMVEFGGGMTKPLYAPSHAAAQATTTQAVG